MKAEAYGDIYFIVHPFDVQDTLESCGYIVARVCPVWGDQLRNITAYAIAIIGAPPETLRRDLYDSFCEEVVITGVLPESGGTLINLLLIGKMPERIAA